MSSLLGRLTPRTWAWSPSACRLSSYDRGCSSAAGIGNASSCVLIPPVAWLGSSPTPSSWRMSRMLTTRRERDMSNPVLYRGRHGTAVCGRLSLVIPAHRSHAAAVSHLFLLTQDSPASAPVLCPSDPDSLFWAAISIHLFLLLSCASAQTTQTSCRESSIMAYFERRHKLTPVALVSANSPRARCCTARMSPRSRQPRAQSWRRPRSRQP